MRRDILYMNGSYASNSNHVSPILSLLLGISPMLPCPSISVVIIPPLWRFPLLCGVLHISDVIHINFGQISFQPIICVHTSFIFSSHRREKLHFGVLKKR